MKKNNKYSKFLAKHQIYFTNRSLTKKCSKISSTNYAKIPKFNTRLKIFYKEKFLI